MTVPGLPLIGTVALVMLGVFLLTRLPVVGRLFSALLWVGSTTLLFVFLAEQGRFHPHLAAVFERLGLDRQTVSGREVRVTMSGDGHFWVRAKIGGVERRMLVDSGATVTAISERTATAARVAVKTGLTPVVLQTANGTTFARPASIARLTVGGIEARDLPVVVSPAFGDIDVLGMNFLTQLASWRVEGRTLILVPKAPKRAAPA